MDRRSLLRRVVAGFSVVAAAGFSFPFLRSLLPDFDNVTTLDVDVSNLEPGESKLVRWLGRQVYVIRRSVSDSGEQASLQDPDSVNSRQPDWARNSHRSRKPDLLLVYANCTHLGCEVELLSDDRDRTFDGFSCPCHRSRFDRSGRVEAGSAATLNLEVPEYDYVAREVIRLRHVHS